MNKKEYLTPELAVLAVNDKDVVLESPLSENPTEVGLVRKEGKRND